MLRKKKRVAADWTMRVVYEPAALKGLSRLPARDCAALRRKMVAYAQSGVGDVVKMTGTEEWRLRHGDWRAIFVVRNDLIVLRVAHRREAYR